MTALGLPTHAVATTVVRATPQGEVAQVRQVVIGFSEAVVPFGDLRQPPPFTVSCNGAAPQGSGRWSTDRVWLYDFREALPPGTVCDLKPVVGWKPIGTALTGRTDYRFGTGGPSVTSMTPGGGTVEEDQHFLARLNGPAVAASVEANAWCEVEGIGERLPLKVVTGNVRDELIKQRQLEKQADRLLVLTCQRPLPNDARLRLVWGRGIAVAANPSVVTSVEQRFEYQVRKAFTAEFSCEREKADLPCLPVRPLSVSMSAPIAKSEAAKIRLRPESGDAIAPAFDADDRSEEVVGVTFATPLPENTRYTLELPAALKDTSGRALANAGSFPLKVATGSMPPIAKFAAAPFGVVEANGDAMLPVTLRHVQPDIRGGVAAAAASAAVTPSGAVRVKRLTSDADILRWYASVAKYHETKLSARELGRPQSEWKEAQQVTDARGRSRTVMVDRMIGTREVSLLRTEPDAKRLDLPQLQGGDPRPFEVVGIPLAEPGYQVVEIESARLGESLLDKHAPMFVRTGVLLTNLGVHFKHGRENSLAWVTTLDTGKPVPQAQVTVNDCRGKPLWTGATDAQGIARIAQVLASADSGECPADQGYFVTARKADAKGATDVAFVFSSWQKGIESWRFNVPTSSDPEPDTRAHTVFDRTLLRAGETVSMKHFLRMETSAGLAFLAPADLPTQVKVTHQGTGQSFTQALQWNAARSAVSTWAIPAAAKLGVYDVTLERADTAASASSVASSLDPAAARRNRQRSWPSGSFRVEEFRLPLIDARLSGPSGAVVAPGELPIQVQLNYFSGGAMARAPARASAVLKSRRVSFPGYDEFAFEPPRAVTPGSNSSDPDADSDADDGADASQKLVLDKQPLTTDADGAATVTLKDLPKIARPSAIQAEVTYNDPNGEAQTASTQVDLWPSAVVLGVKTGSWASSRGKVKFQVLALDTGGKPIKGQAVTVRGRLSQVISTRKRMVGGFYAYDNRTEVKDLGSLCSGSSDDRGLVLCEASLDQAGQVELIAQATDGGGHAVEAASSVWVTKQGELWFAQDNDDRIDLLPEKKRYEPGETARLQVRMPFREATVLVSVEREGVIDARVMTLRGDDPTIELPIASGWGPNVYVSVLALRGRIREVPWYSFFTWGWKEPANWVRSFWYEGREYQAPTAMVDLSKPAYKLGLAALQVGVGEHRLEVSVTPDQPQYTIRQTAKARVKVLSAGKPLANTEVAFAAVDEGLLSLRANDSWDLLTAMLAQRSYGVETATGQSEIIGRRHYGRKAVAAGGGGGRGATRELFDTLLVWKPQVMLDANGEAVVDVPINDSLTSFRLVAIADAGTGAEMQRFGTGSASIKVSQDLQALSGLPPLVREGDRFTAMLTLRNTTSREMKVRATLRGTSSDVPAPAPAASRPKGGITVLGDVGLVPFDRNAITTEPQDVVVPAGGAKEVSWPLTVPDGATKLTWEASADEQGGGGTNPARDRIRVTQSVVPAVPVRVLQATLAQLDGSYSLPIAAPADALPETGAKRGGLQIGVQPKLSGALPGIRRYFENYPFVCLEQKVSKAVGLHDDWVWTTVANQLPTYLDSDGLASYFPPRAEDAPQGSDRLTAYLLAATNEAQFALPAASQEAMLSGLTQFVDGRIQRDTWAPQASRAINLDVRKLSAIEALSRYGRAQPRMLGSINLTPNVWPTAAVIDWYSILKRLTGVPDRARRMEEASQILRSRMTFAGTTLRFNTEESDFWWWLMDSADANAARLLLAVMDDPAWKDDIGRMVVGSLGRQKGGAWLTTTANLWGSLALDKFSAAFESTPVTGRTVAGYAGAATGVIGAPAATSAAGVQSTGAAAFAASSAATGDASNPAGSPGRQESSSTAATPASIDWARSAEGGRIALPWPAGPSTLTVTQQGAGKPWLSVQSLAAIALKAPVAAGYGLTRTVTAIEQKTAGVWTRGDVVKVHLEVDAQSDMTWVVVSDPVPGGAALLGTGLGRDSQIATASQKTDNRTWPVFEERSFEAFRSYYDVLPRGKHVIEYTLRLNNPGRFALPPTRVEALYSPETFGELPNEAVEVKP